MRIKYRDGGLTNAVCDVLYQAEGFDNMEPTIEDFFSDDFATQYAARCWEEWINKISEEN